MNREELNRSGERRPITNCIFAEPGIVLELVADERRERPDHEALFAAFRAAQSAFNLLYILCDVSQNLPNRPARGTSNRAAEAQLSE